jgi:peptide/nickel transport system substrate-binding protein
MRSRVFGSRSSALILSCLVVVVAASSRRSFVWARAARQGVAAPKIDILKTEPFDRITLNDGTVFVIEPVMPRPLPAYDPAVEAEKERKRKAGTKELGLPEGGNVGVRTKKKAAPKIEDEVAAELAIHLIEGEQRDFKIKRADIKSVEYFEDMLLDEGDRLLRAQEYNKAFECYLRVRTRNPRWKGLSTRVDEMLYKEGTIALLDGDGDRGLRILRELKSRKPNYPGLDDALAKAYVERIDKAFDADAYFLARRFLHTIEEIVPSNPLVIAARERFVKLARDLATEAAKRQGGEKLDFYAEALRVWPEYEPAIKPYEDAFRALPTLDVAVDDLPRPISPWLRTSADARVSRLIYLPLLASIEQDSLDGKTPGQLAASVKTGELGKRLIIKLRNDIKWTDDSRVVGSIDVARTFADRFDPYSLGYQARWAELLDRIETPAADQIEIRFTRPTLRPEYHLLTPIGPAQAGHEGWVVTANGRIPLGDGPYRWESETAEVVRFAAVGDSTTANAPKIRRIREAKFAPGALVGALARGEVSLVERVAHADLPRLQADSEIKIGAYKNPTMHWLALDGRNPALRNRTLRRALAYAIDRKTIFEETVLRAPMDEANTLSDGAFPKGNYADAPGVRPIDYDALLAKSLVAGARKEIETTAIHLNFEYPMIPEVEAAALKIVAAIKEAGIDVHASARPLSELEANLRSGRPFDIAYRTGRCVDPVFEAGPILCPGYDAPATLNPLASLASPRILQILLQVEQLVEWPAARELIQQLDREVRDELPIIPLWQTQDHYAWRSRLTGPAETADNLYQGIESWEIAPWFARDAK